MSRNSIRVIHQFLSARLAQASIPEQIKIYEALAHVMPTKKERLAAERIAWTLRQASKMQLDFSKQLFTEMQWRGHRHNGGTHDS